MEKLDALFDVIVVGGGSAGAALAGRLSENPDRSVLLLEAGQDFPQIADFPLEIQRVNVVSPLAPGSECGWPLVSEWTPGTKLPSPRGRVIGGGSAVNGAYYIRGLARDFDAWAEAGGHDWSFDKVLPFFRDGEVDREFGADASAHGGSGPIPITRVARQDMTRISDSFYQACLDLGFEEDLDKNRVDAGNGIGPLPTNTVDGMRFNSAMAHLSPRRHKPNLTIVGNAHVQRVTFRGNRATGVEVIVDRRLRTVRGGEVILSAGATQSPHLLMLSGVGPADQLLAHDIRVLQDLPGIGKDFIDHTGMLIGFEPSQPSPKGPHDIGLIEAVLHKTAEGSQFPSDLEIMPMTMSMVEAAMGKAAGLPPLKVAAAMAKHPIAARREISRSNLPAMMRMGSSMAMTGFIVQVLTPMARGDLRLVSNKPSVFLNSEHNMFSEAEDRRRQREAVRLTVEIMRSPAFAPVVKKIAPSVWRPWTPTGSSTRCSSTARRRPRT